MQRFCSNDGVPALWRTATAVAGPLPIITLGAHAPEGYGSRRVCVCVCVRLLSHLTSGASARRENAATYSAGNEGQKTCGVFSETPPLPRSSDPSLGQPYIRSAIFPADNTHAHCAYASSPSFAMDAPCRKLSLRSSFMMMESSV